jgi:2-furoyl-CoA dehydrogenase large subunit
LSGEASGALGFGGGTGYVTLEESDGTTTINYRYEAGIGGKVASIGGRLLDGAARFLISQFFAALAKQASGEAGSTSGGFLARLVAKFRGRA